MRNHMKIIVRGGRILNPSDKTDIIGDLYIEDGVIKEIGPSLEVSTIFFRSTNDILPLTNALK